MTVWSGTSAISPRINTLSQPDAAKHVISLIHEYELDDDTLLSYYEQYVSKIGLIPGFAEYLDNELKEQSNGMDKR
jgi:hypothetical protein